MSLLLTLQLTQEGLESEERRETRPTKSAASSAMFRWYSAVLSCGTGTPGHLTRIQLPQQAAFREEVRIRKKEQRINTCHLFEEQVAVAVNLSHPRTRTNYREHRASQSRSCAQSRLLPIVA
eukprot:scaffold6429_cov77-Skeletonema_dohrnii-CCMP3373.AAC.3